MKTLNILKNNRQNLINNLNENIVSLEKIAFEQQAEIERLQLKVEVIQEAKEQLEKDVFNAEMNLDGKDVEIMNLKHEIERLKADLEYYQKGCHNLCKELDAEKIKNF